MSFVSESQHLPHLFVIDDLDTQLTIHEQKGAMVVAEYATALAGPAMRLRSKHQPAVSSIRRLIHLRLECK